MLKGSLRKAQPLLPRKYNGCDSMKCHYTHAQNFFLEVAKAVEQLAYENALVHIFLMFLKLHNFLGGEMKLHWEGIFTLKSGKYVSNSFEVCNPDRNKKKREESPTLSFSLYRLISKT